MPIHSLCIHPKNMSLAQEHTSPLLGGREGFQEEDLLSRDTTNGKGEGSPKRCEAKDKGLLGDTS